MVFEKKFIKYSDIDILLKMKINSQIFQEDQHPITIEEISFLREIVRKNPNILFDNKKISSVLPVLIFNSLIQKKLKNHDSSNLIDVLDSLKRNYSLWGKTNPSLINLKKTLFSFHKHYLQKYLI
jgi:hypothetical protein